MCKGIPKEFADYITYCRNLRFEDKPDYVFLKGLFKDLFTKSGYDFDYVYDWIDIKQEIIGSTSTAKVIPENKVNSLLCFK